MNVTRGNFSMGRFLCYEKDNSEECDAWRIEACDAGSAAEEYAEKQSNQGSFEGDTMDVMVTADDEAVWICFEVEKQVEFSFHAMRLD